MFTTYSLFDNYRHDDDARQIAVRIGALRNERRLAPPRLIIEMNAEAGRAAAEVQAGRRTTAEALDALLHRMVDNLGRSVHAWVAETTSLDRIKLPDELVGMPALSLGIWVAHHKAEGQPWGRFVVFIVVLDESATGMTARAEGAGAVF